jgi:hypothetical protein
MRYLMYWLALGAAGIALNVVFALFGFGNLHRLLQQSKIKVGGTARARAGIWTGAAIGLVVGVAVALFFGPFNIIWTLTQLRAPKKD